MRRTALLAAAIGSLLASSSFAAFTFTAAPTPTGNGNLRVDIYARNDGAAVGSAIPAGTTKVQGVEITGQTVSPGTTFKFRYAGGAVDLYNNRGAPIDVFGDGSLIAPNNNSSLYLAQASGDNTYQGLNPPSSDASWASITNFQVSYAATGTTAPNATAASNGGLGARIASLVINPTGGFTLNGNIGAESGTKVPFSVSFPVPEPTTLASLGLLGLGLVRRRK